MVVALSLGSTIWVLSFVLLLSIFFLLLSIQCELLSFVMKNIQYTSFLWKNIELSNWAIHRKPHSSRRMAQFLLVRETPMVTTAPADSSGGVRQSRESLQAKKHFCLNYLYLQTKSFSSLKLSRRPSLCFSLSLHAQPWNQSWWRH